MISDFTEHLQTILRVLPDRPGVYQFFNEEK